MNCKLVASFQLMQTEQWLEKKSFGGVSPNRISPLFFLDHLRNSVSPLADYPFISAPYIFADSLQWVTFTTWNAGKTTATLISIFLGPLFSSSYRQSSTCWVTQQHYFTDSHPTSGYVRTSGAGENIPIFWIYSKITKFQIQLGWIWHREVDRELSCI